MRFAVTPIPRPRPFAILDPILGFQGGGVVPGPLGAPQLARVHGGETIFPGGPMVINLIMDKKVIGTASIDAVHRTAKFNAGMMPGSIGS